MLFVESQNQFNKAVENFLHSTGFLPFEKWNRFEIEHTTHSPTKEEKRKAKKFTQFLSQGSQAYTLILITPVTYYM